MWHYLIFQIDLDKILKFVLSYKQLNQSHFNVKDTAK